MEELILFVLHVFFDQLRYNPDDEVKPQVALKEEAVAQEEELQEITQQEKDEKPAAPVREPAESSGKRDEQQDKDQANKGKQPAEDQGQAGKPAVDQEEKAKQHGGEKKASALAEPVDLSNEQMQDVLGKLPAHILPPDVVCSFIHLLTLLLLCLLSYHTCALFAC